MVLDRAVFRTALERGEEEGGNVEFKERLTRDVHLADGRLESLAAQLRHRVLSGDGEALYVVGVTDDGGIAGTPPDVFSETLDVLSFLAEEAGAHIADVQTWSTDDGVAEFHAAGRDAAAADEAADGLVGIASIHDGTALDGGDDHIIVGTAGHVDHGKSTLVGSLVTGRADDGDGGTRGVMDVQPHERERGLSADISYGVYGFADGDVVHVDHPNRKAERAKVVETADRVVSFVDTVGHEPWLHTTIRGLVGQKLDYGLLVVAADDGPTATTREHLGVLLATELPTIVAITKTDLVGEARLVEVETEVERLLRGAGRTPLPVSRYGVDTAIEEIDDTVVPLVRTSAVTETGFDVLHEMFEQLPKTAGEREGDFRLYVDRSYNVTGVGAVASGTIESGSVAAGDELLLGPFPDGSFRDVEVRSIEMHYHRVDRADAGRIVGIALSGVHAREMTRGMALVPRDSRPRATRTFEADVMVLNHPTRIDDGYEPVVHLETIGEAAVFHPEDGQLLPGSTGSATVRFKFQPYLIEEGQRFVFREGSSKGVGTVRELVD